MSRKLKVYLSGATLNVEKEFQSWREACLSYSKNGYYDKISFIDPISYFDYTYKLPMTEKQCLDFFMWQIDQCDVLLCNLDNSKISIGTAMEVEHAYCNNKPVIGFGSNIDTHYNWTRERCSAIFDTLEEALHYIHNYYGKVVCE